MKRWIFTAIVLMATSTAYAGGLTAEEARAFGAINEFRAQFGLPALALSPDLTDASRAWSVRMRASGRLFHGASMENCAAGNTCGVATFRQWERSPGHRALLLSRTATEMGVGNSGTFWTLRMRVRERESVTASAPVVRQTYTSADRSKRPLKRCLRRLCR